MRHTNVLWHLHQRLLQHHAMLSTSNCQYQKSTTALATNGTILLLAMCFGVWVWICGSGGISMLADLRIMNIHIQTQLTFSVTQTCSYSLTIFLLILFGILPCNCCSLYQCIAWLHSSHSCLLPVTGRTATSRGCKTPLWVYLLISQESEKKQMKTYGCINKCLWCPCYC